MRTVSVKRKRPNEAQQQSENLFRMAFAQASVGMAITDSKGHFWAGE